MNNFELGRSTRVVFGRGTENQAGLEIKKLGGSRVLLVYGTGSIKKTGLYDKVVSALKNENLEFAELGGVVPNPRLSLVREGIKRCRENNIDFLLAVGGGSVIDTAKAIAVGVPYEGDVWDFSEKKIAPETALPVGVVLTIPAAGSETSKYSVITNDEVPYPMKRDAVYENQEIIRPVFAIMNPELTFTLSPYQTACGITDIMAHTMERYFSSTKNVELSDRLCEATLKTVIHNAGIVMREPENYDARAEIMWAGSIAHNDYLGMGRETDFASHKIEHELSALYDIAHGAGLAIVFPAWAKHVYRDNLDRFVQFAVRVWDVEMNFYDPEDTALEGIRRLEAFFRSLGLPTTLTEVEIPSDRFTEMAQKSTKGGSIRKIDDDDVVKILELAR